MEGSWKNIEPKLRRDILKTLKCLEFAYPTPVQAACIPLFLQNKDVVAEAVTGSGKTLAFVIPILEILSKREQALRKYDIGALIITPTGELAVQITEVLTDFIKPFPHLSVLCITGIGHPGDHITRFKEHGGHIIVTTPGRLDNLLTKQFSEINLSSCLKALDVLVLDEADRLLGLGFEASINTILSFLPKQRRTGLFSATQSDELETLVRAGLRNPVRITVSEKGSSSQSSEPQIRTPTLLQNYYMICGADEKLNQLLHFLRTHSTDKTMVFFSNCASVDYFSKAAVNVLKHITVLGIHGKMKKKRIQMFTKFRSLESGVLMCTDVMARGIDIIDVQWVIQYNPPTAPNDFIHRCGRTARISHLGHALMFLLPTEEAYVHFITINQRVYLERMSKAENVNNYLPQIQRLSLKDRGMYEKGMKAFVSYVQSYSKHVCKYLFKMKDLDFGKMATGFGLIKMPRMPELKGTKQQGFTPVDIDVNTIPYKEKSLAVQRAKDQQAGKKKYKPKQIAWSKQKAQIEKKKARQEKAAKREIQSLHKPAEQKLHKPAEQKLHKPAGHKRKSSAMTEDEVEELMRDARLLMKFKKGKVSGKEYDDQMQADMEELSDEEDT